MTFDKPLDFPTPEPPSLAAGESPLDHRLPTHMEVGGALKAWLEALLAHSIMIDHPSVARLAADGAGSERLSVRLHAESQADDRLPRIVMRPHPWAWQTSASMGELGVSIQAPQMSALRVPHASVAVCRIRTTFSSSSSAQLDAIVHEFGTALQRDRVALARELRVQAINLDFPEQPDEKRDDGTSPRPGRLFESVATISATAAGMWVSEEESPL